MTLVPPEFWTRRNFRRSHRIDVYARATLIQRDLRSGSWLIEGIPGDSDAAADLEAGGGIIAYYRGPTGAQAVLDSGRVENVSVVDEYDETAGGMVSNKTVGGPLDLAFVEDRKAHPDPFTLDTSIDESKLYNGPAESALKDVVSDNLGPTAHPSRMQASFAIATDLGRGDNVYDEVRFTDMTKVLAGWSVVGGIIPTCKVSAGQLVFDVYVPRDLRRFVVISIARGTAIRARRSERAPTLTYEYVGLQGEGTARVFVEGGDTASQIRWGFRREVLRDRRDTNDVAVGQQQLAEDLATQAAAVAMEVDPIDTIAAQFGVDYQLGDLVTAVGADGSLVAKQIREVQIECTPEDVVRFRPVLADPLTPSPDDLAMFGDLRDLSSRLTTQEAR